VDIEKLKIHSKIKVIFILYINYLYLQSTMSKYTKIVNKLIDFTDKPSTMNCHVAAIVAGGKIINVRPCHHNLHAEFNVINSYEKACIECEEEE